MIITNTTKSVKVLKALGLPNLRLFPGPNKVDRENISDYFKGNIAAQSLQKDGTLIEVNEDGLSTDEKTIADRSKEKNDELNKAQKMIQLSQEKILKKESKIEEQKNKLDEQMKIIKEQGDRIDKLTDKIDSITKTKK